jgi:Cu/Ag efflux protein CusF
VDGDAISPNWESSKTLARFQLKFVEPQPVKRIINANGGKITLNFHTEKLTSIGWGDGTYFYDLVGDVNVGSELPEGTQIVIMGDIEEITNFELTGGTVQWDIYA